MKKIRKVILGFIVVFALFITGCFINHQVQLHNEASLLKVQGKLVEVNHHKMNVLVEGNSKSKNTLVFLSGAGTCSPVLDFKTLYSKFEKDYRIVVIEKAGYGYSEDSNSSRKIDTMLLETRDALYKAGVDRKNLVLFPHSMSGLEAIYWANKYPDEIKAIVGLDIALPKSYKNLNMHINLAKIARFAMKCGVVRCLPFIANDSAAIQYGNLTAKEKSIYRALFYKMTMSQAMMNEMTTAKDNAKKVDEIDKTEVPMLLFASNAKTTSFTIKDWHKFTEEYCSASNNRQYQFLECAHYVHDIKADTIYKQSEKFMKAL